jgi:hypothetical protein
MKFETKGQLVYELLVENRFVIQGQCDLELWPCDTKINSTFTSQGQFVCEIWRPRPHVLSNYWSETVLTYNVNVTLTLSPRLKTQRGHLLPKTNELLKSEGQWLMDCRVIGRKLLWLLVLWSYDPKSNRVRVLAKINAPVKFEGPWVVKLLVGNSFYIHGKCDLDLSALDFKHFLS